jgi:uncharacterized protein
MPKKIMSFLGVLLLVYVSMLGGLYLAQRKMLYYPNVSKPDIKEVPFSNAQEITVKTKDNLQLTAWYLPSANPGLPIIVFFHGNASNMLWSMYKMPKYIEAGYGILSAEYRGYSGNPGSPSEQGFYNDGRAYINWLKTQNIHEDQIILYAESIGTGVAIQMATEYEPFQAIVLESPFTSMVDLVRRHYWFAPTILLKDRYESMEKIGKIKSPLIVLHGTNDSIVPQSMGQMLFEAAPQPKTFISIEGADHNNLMNFDAAPKILSALSE